MKTNFIVSNSYNSELFVQNFSENENTETVQAKSNKPSIPVPSRVEIKTRKGEDPRELHRRYLMEAASESGLDGTNQQKEFVERWMKSGISFATKESDPSPDDGLSVRSADLKGEWQAYKLSSDEINDLKRLQKEYTAQGGVLARGRTFENTSDGEAFSMSRRGATGKKPLTDAQYEQRKLRDLWEQAQIPETSVLGTPAKLRDLKHVSVKLSGDKNLPTEDRALLGLIGRQYGGGNIWGDKQNEILSLAKAKGVKIENLNVEGENASFDISVENLLKTHIAYINVQEQVNDAEKITNEVRDKMALNQFLIGAGEGAWGAVKANYNMIRHPIETYNQIKEAVGFIKNLSQDDLMKIYDSLKAEGHKFIFEKDISEVSRDVGKVVGAAAVEFILGKGIGAGLKALRGLKSFPTIIEGMNKAKQAFNKIPIPVPGVKVAVDTMGNKIFLPDVEIKKLEDLILTMKSSEDKLGMLKTGTTAGRETIKNTAEEGLTEISQSGMKRLKYELPKEILKRAKEKLVVLNVARTELIAKLDDLIAGGKLSADTNKVLSTARNSLKDHLTQDDLVGALRDKFGKEVRRSGDGYTYQHLGEVMSSINSLDNATLRLVRELSRIPKGTDYSRISREIDGIKEMKRRVTDFLETK